MLFKELLRTFPIAGYRKTGFTSFWELESDLILGGKNMLNQPTVKPKT